ncbi:MAG: hypothetical protein KKE50_01700 [Nanoarchaeota archaeon]|nr:hypothetical protein [Nanoarchaeota archaeon]
MKEEIFLEVLKKLNGLNYLFFSGMAVSVYTEGKREAGDTDVIVHKKDINKFAKRMGTKVKKRFFDKGTFFGEDYGFVIDFKGQEVEATNGYPRERMAKGTFDKLFKRKVRKIFLGKEVFIEPIEELIVQKAFMHREKDLADLKLLLNQKIDKDFVIELAEDWGKKQEILKVLKEIGYMV